MRYYAGYVAGKDGAGKSEVIAQVEQSAADLGYNTYIVNCSTSHTTVSFLQDVLNALDRVKESDKVNQVAANSRRMLRFVAQRLASPEFFSPSGKASAVVVLDNAPRWDKNRHLFEMLAELIDMRLCPFVLTGWREMYDSLLQRQETHDFRWRMPTVCELQSLDETEFQRLIDTLGEISYPPLVRKAMWETVGKTKSSISDVQWLLETLDRMKYSVKEATIELVQQVWATRRERER
jgi:hypothetical protein